MEEDVVEAREVVEEPTTSPPEDQDTLPTPQMPAVTAISSMVQTRGIVWPHSPVHGSTNVLQDNEDLTSLEEIRKLVLWIMTHCIHKSTRWKYKFQTFL